MKPKSHRYSRWFSFIFVSLMIALAIFVFSPVSATPIVSVGPVVQLSSTAGAQQGVAAQGGIPETACQVASSPAAWVVVWGESATTLDYSFSTDGITWSPKALLITWANSMQSVSGGFAYFATCSGTTLAVGYEIAGGAQRPFYATFNMASPASPIVGAVETQTTGWVEGAAATKCITGSYDSGGNLWITAGDNPNTMRVVENGGLVFSLTTAGSQDCGNVPIQTTTDYLYWIKTYNQAGVTQNFGTATSSSVFVSNTRAGGEFGIIVGTSSGSGECAVGNTCIFTTAGNAAAAASSTCFFDVYNTFTGAVVEYTPTGIPTTYCGRSNSAIGSYSVSLQGWVATDGASNIWAVFGLNQPLTLMTSNDVGTNWAFTTFGNTFGSSLTAEPIGYLSEIKAMGGTLQAVAVESRATDGVYVQVFTTTNTGVGSGSQTVGSCPTKNTATFTPVNNTIYLYVGNALGNEVVNTVSTAVASVTSGTHTLRLLIYVATTPTVSVLSPLNKAYEKSFSVTTGTTNQIITAQANVQLGGLAPIFGGNTWAVGLVADDHFRINQSSLSGLSTLTGNPSANTQPATFSTLGTSVGSQIYLCAVASYQLILTVLSTTTTTAPATTSVTVTNTVSSTVLVNQANPATAAFWFIPLMFLMLPTGIFLGVAILVQGRRR